MTLSPVGTAPPMPLQLWLDDGARTRVLSERGRMGLRPARRASPRARHGVESDPDLLKPAALRRRSPRVAPLGGCEPVRHHQGRLTVSVAVAVVAQGTRAWRTHAEASSERRSRPVRRSPREPPLIAPGSGGQRLGGGHRATPPGRLGRCRVSFGAAAIAAEGTAIATSAPPTRMRPGDGVTGPLPGVSPSRT